MIAVGTTLAAGSGNDITLTNAGNNFDAGGGAASLIVTSGRNVQIVDGNSLQLGNVTTAGTLSVTANGVITQAADTAAVAAGTTLAAGSTHDIAATQRDGRLPLVALKLPDTARQGAVKEERPVPSSPAQLPLLG